MANNCILTLTGNWPHNPQMVNLVRAENGFDFVFLNSTNLFLSLFLFFEYKHDYVGLKLL